MAAIYDWIRVEKNDSLMENILLSFSPITNVKKLFTISNGQEDDLTCIHGIRFLAICMVNVGHTLALNNSNSFRKKFIFQMLLLIF